MYRRFNIEDSVDDLQQTKDLNTLRLLLQIYKQFFSSIDFQLMENIPQVF